MSPFPIPIFYFHLPVFFSSQLQLLREHPHRLCMRGGGALGCFIPVSAHPWESNNFGRGTLPYCPCLCVFFCVYVRMWGRSGPWVFHPSRSNDAPTPLWFDYCEAVSASQTPILGGTCAASMADPWPIFRFWSPTMLGTFGTLFRKRNSVPFRQIEALES